MVSPSVFVQKHLVLHRVFRRERDDVHRDDFNITAEIAFVKQHERLFRHFFPLPGQRRKDVRDAPEAVKHMQDRREVLSRTLPPPGSPDSAPPVSATAPCVKGTSKIGFRRLFAFEPSPTGKIFGGYLQAATFKSSCIGLFAHTLKNHPVEFLEKPLNPQLKTIPV